MHLQGVNHPGNYSFSLMKSSFWTNLPNCTGIFFSQSLWITTKFSMVTELCGGITGEFILHQSYMTVNQGGIFFCCSLRIHWLSLPSLSFSSLQTLKGNVSALPRSAIDHCKSISSISHSVTWLKTTICDATTA